MKCKDCKHWDGESKRHSSGFEGFGECRRIEYMFGVSYFDEVERTEKLKDEYKNDTAFVIDDDLSGAYLHCHESHFCAMFEQID